MRLSRAFLLTFLTREGVLVLAFLNSVVLARTLGVEGVGVYSLIVTSANILAFAGTLGLNFSNTLLAARNPERAGHLFVQSIVPLLLLAGPAMAVEACWPQAVEFMFGTIGHRLRLYALAGTGLLSLNTNLAAIFFGLQRFKRHSVVTIVVAPGMLLTNLVLRGQSALTVEHALDVWLVWQAGALLLTAALLIPIARPRFDLPLATLAESFRVGGRALLTTILGFTAHRGTVLLISQVLGKTALGLYSVALPMSEALQHAPSALGALVTTKASAGENSPEDVGRALRLHLLFSGTLALVLALVAPWIFGFFFGDRYADAVLPFRILLAGHYLMGVWSLSAGYISGKHAYPPAVIVLTGVVAALNLTLGLWWVRVAGLPGAAAAWSVSAILGSLAMLGVFVQKAEDRLRWRDLVPGLPDLRFAWTTFRGVAGAR
jgi:O-antigen/teichoic acid export membrane protein